MRQFKRWNKMKTLSRLVTFIWWDEYLFIKGETNKINLFIIYLFSSGAGSLLKEGSQTDYNSVRVWLLRDYLLAYKNAGNDHKNSRIRYHFLLLFDPIVTIVPCSHELSPLADQVALDWVCCVWCWVDSEDLSSSCCS